MNKITAALAAVAFSVLAFVGAGTASADAHVEVCDAIDAAPSYRSYLIDAAIYGIQRGWDAETQARNIVQSVAVFCPQHMDGMYAAAEALAN